MIEGSRRLELLIGGDRYTCRKHVFGGSESLAEHTLSEHEVRSLLQTCALPIWAELLDTLQRFAGMHPRDPRGLAELATRLTDPLLGNLVLQRRVPRGLPPIRLVEDELVDLTPQEEEPPWITIALRGPLGELYPDARVRVTCGGTTCFEGALPPDGFWRHQALPKDESCEFELLAAGPSRGATAPPSTMSAVVRPTSPSARLSPRRHHVVVLRRPLHVFSR